MKLLIILFIIGIKEKLLKKDCKIWGTIKPKSIKSYYLER